jgi:acyl carrier protein
MKESEILEIVQKGLGATESPITMDSSANDVPEWDSLGQINIIVALDEALGGKVSELQEMATAGSMRKIVDLLRHHNLVEVS